MVFQILSASNEAIKVVTLLRLSGTGITSLIYLNQWFSIVFHDKSPNLCDRYVATSIRMSSSGETSSCCY